MYGARTLESHHEIFKRILVLLVRFGVVLFGILVDRLLDDLDGALEGGTSMG